MSCLSKCLTQLLCLSLGHRAVWAVLGALRKCHLIVVCWKKGSPFCCAITKAQLRGAGAAYFQESTVLGTKHSG